MFYRVCTDLTVFIYSLTVNPIWQTMTEGRPQLLCRRVPVAGLRKNIVFELPGEFDLR